MVDCDLGRRSAVRCWFSPCSPHSVAQPTASVPRRARHNLRHLVKHGRRGGEQVRCLERDGLHCVSRAALTSAAQFPLVHRFQNAHQLSPTERLPTHRHTHPRRSGLVAGTGCIICSKTLFELKAVGISGVEETFEPQVFQPFVMFFGMLFALPMYLALEARKRIRARSDPALRAELDAAPPITVRRLRLPRSQLGQRRHQRALTAPTLTRTPHP